MNYQPSRTSVEFGSRDRDVTYVRRRAAYVVVRDGGQFLAVRGSAGYFLPGGGCEAGESFESCVTREVAEETAFELTELTSIGIATQFFYAASDGVHYEAQFAFFTGRVGLGLDNEPEHTLHWMPIEDARAILFHESHVWALCTAQSISGESMIDSPV